jgi:dipeptidyl-peptidase-4
LACVGKEWAVATRQQRIAILRGIVLSLAGCMSSAYMHAQSHSLADILRREFIQREFAVKSFGPARWLNGGQGFTTLESPSSSPATRDIVRYETATGKREVVVSGSELKVPNSKEPLKIEDYSLSADLNRVLIFTNSKRVWRTNTRGDYWVLDRKSRNLHKIDARGPPSSLMFAKFSPDGSKVGYVRFNVEDLQTGLTSRLTADGSDKIINGASDWVYEEEFSLRDAFRWSPDGTHIAYWQFNTSNLKNFPLIYDIGGPYNVVTAIPYPEYGVYPTVRQIPYPQAGTQNSSARIGVVPALGGETRWMQVPGYADENYIARMDWTGDSDTLILQHLNRLQNTNEVLLADVKSEEVRRIYQDKDAAWVDVVDNLRWIHGGRDFLWLSEQDGWLHTLMISRPIFIGLFTPTPLSTRLP